MDKDEKEFIVYLKQGGEGCDYTIGCGQKMIRLYAKDITQATERFITMLSSDFDNDDVDWTDDYGGYYSDTELDKAIIYEVTYHHRVDLNAAYSNLAEVKLLAERLKKEELEKKEFERLKQKYG